MRPEPANKLKPEERQLILDTMNSEEFASKTPCEVVHPERWSGDIRNWEYSEIEWLDPRQVTEDKKEAKAS